MTATLVPTDTPLLPDPPHPNAPSRGGMVRVPRVVTAACVGSPTMLALAAVLYDLQSGRTGVVRVGQSKIMRRLGRPGRDATVVRRHVKALRQAGLLDVRRVGLGRYRYQLRVLPGGDERWDEIPHPMMDALADGEVTPALLPVWIGYHRATGSGGSTNDTDSALAERYDLGLSARSVRRHRERLTALGYLRTRRCADGSLMIYRASLLGGPVAKNAASGWPKMPPLGGASLAPERELAPENPSTSALADDRPVLMAHDGDGADAQTNDDLPEPTTTPREPAKPRSMPKRGGTRRFWGGGASDDPVVARVLGGLPEQWRTGWHRPYTRPIAVAIREAITERPEDPEHLALAPDAARYAMRHLTDPERHRDRTVPAAKEALRLLASLTRAGLACRDCGHDDRPMSHGLCMECTALDTTHDPASLALIPIEERRAVYASLGLDPDDAGTPEPPESHVSAYQTQTGTDPHLSAESASEATTGALAGIAACRAALTSARTGRS